MQLALVINIAFEWRLNERLRLVFRENRVDLFSHFALKNELILMSERLDRLRLNHKLV